MKKLQFAKLLLTGLILSSIVVSPLSVAAFNHRIDDKKTIAQATLIVDRNRKIAYTNVKEIKSSFKEDSTEYKTAKDKYNTAKDEFEAYTNAVAAAIENGEKLSGTDLDEMSKPASEATKDFITYARKVRGVGGGIALTSILGLGMALFNNYKTNKTEARKERAAELRKSLAWSSWGEIS